MTDVFTDKQNTKRKSNGFQALINITGWRRAGMSNMRPFASTPAARTKDTVIW